MINRGGSATLVWELWRRKALLYCLPSCSAPHLAVPLWPSCVPSPEHASPPPSFSSAPPSATSPRPAQKQWDTIRMHCKPSHLPTT